MNSTLINGHAVPSVVPLWHTPATQDGHVITHANGAPLMLVPPQKPLQKSPLDAWLTTDASGAPHRLHAPSLPRPEGIASAELRDLPPDLQAKLLAQAAPLFQAEWADIDPRYRQVEGVIATLTERSRSDDPLERLFVKYRGEELVATGSLCRRDNPPFDNPFEAAKGGSLQAGRKYADGWLVDLYTVEKYRRQGHATDLIRTVFDASAGQLHLYCTPGLEALYARFGFAKIGCEIVDPVAAGAAQEVETIMRIPGPSLHYTDTPFEPRIDPRTGQPMRANVDKPLPNLPQEAGGPLFKALPPLPGSPSLPPRPESAGQGGMRDFLERLP